VDVCPDERHIAHFFEQPARAQILVGKRHRFSLFSEHLSGEAMEHQAELIRAHGIKVINIIRDGQDVVYSDHNNVSPRRWVAAMRQRGKFADLVDVEISYEDLVRRPDDVQQRVAENLGLSIKYRWSDYPTFVPDEEFAAISSATYAKRPLDDRSVGKGLPYRDVVLDMVSGFDRELESAGYQNARGADYYDRTYQALMDDEASRERMRALANSIAPHVRGDVLDLGCGLGFLAGVVDSDYLGVDFSRGAVEYARQRTGKRFLIGDMRNLPDLGRFGTAVLCEVLEHLDEPAAMVQQAFQIVDRVIVTLPVNIPDPAHVKPSWSENDIKKLLGDGATCEKILSGVYWLAVVDA